MDKSLEKQLYTINSGGGIVSLTSKIIMTSQFVTGTFLYIRCKDCTTLTNSVSTASFVKVRLSHGKMRLRLRHERVSKTRSTSCTSKGRYSVLHISVSEGAIARRDTSCLDIVTRAEWGAKPAKQRDSITSLPVPFVILHHTYRPRGCNSSEECKQAMRNIQHMHQDLRGWFDIGYK
jgi:hypothetical protein